MVTLVLNSPQVDLDILRQLAKDSTLIGVDGGLDHTKRAGLVPDWAVGDFDSVPHSVLAQLGGSTKILRLPVEKDYTDLEVALKLARALEPPSINVLGLAGGDRFDHQLVNTTLLNSIATKGIAIRAWAGRQSIVFTQGVEILQREKGRNFSVFTLGQTATVSIWGAKYSVRRHRLAAASGLGLGNKIEGANALIQVKKGIIAIAQWK